MPAQLTSSIRGSVRRLVLVLGDQLAPRLEETLSIDAERDAVLMAEVAEESTHVRSHRARTALFLSAMRHYALELTERGLRVSYRALGARGNTDTLAGELERAIAALRPECVHLVRPGEWRVLRALEGACSRAGIELVLHEDPHFYLSPAQFEDWARGRKTLLLEHFYRWQRKRLRILVDANGRPESGRWNFDAENRSALGPDAPRPGAPLRFEPDAVTREVFRDIARVLPELPGSVDAFDWGVTRGQALEALADFVDRRLEHFGAYQDALSAGEPWLFHSLLSPYLNLKLLDPRECVEAAVEAYRSGRAPLSSVEGFVRQLIGWREFIRGVYWLEGPEYAERNALDAHAALPSFYWTADTEMRCVSDVVRQVLERGFGHHIQRLMVTGNLALLAGVEPRALSDWYLGMYVDGVDWVTLPNTLGMALHADGGRVGTKPYASTGRYIDRQSDYCSSCRYRPDRRTGDDACPFTTLYWAFLDAQRERLADNHRMALSFKNLGRIAEEELSEIHRRAEELRASWGLEGA